MHYMKYEDVKCTKDGFPICCQDEKVCDVEGCRYFLLSPEIGNCVLRVRDSEKKMTLESLSTSFGITGKKISKQRVEQIEKEALEKLGKKWGTVLREMRNG